MLEPLLTPQELATWLKMSRVWVYKQAEKGLLPFHRVGEVLRFDPGEIQNYLNERRDLKKTYPKSHKQRRIKKGVLLATEQEVSKSS